MTRADEPATAWAASDARVSDPATLFPGDQKSLLDPTVAIDPLDPSVVVAVATDLSAQNVDPSDRGTTRAFRSADGGASWSDLGPLPYDRAGALYDAGEPVALFAPDGVAFLVTRASAPGGGPAGLFVHRSDDAGASWELPTLAVADARSGGACARAERPWLSREPGGALDLAYTEIRGGCGPLLRATQESIRLARSTDDGRSWSAPTVVRRGEAAGAMPRAFADGTIVMPFWSGSPAAGSAIHIGVSRDHGASWTFTAQPQASDPLPDRPDLRGGDRFPAAAIDPVTGIAYVVWPTFDRADGRYVLDVSASWDEGASWSAPVVIAPSGEPDAPPAHPAGEDHRMPAIAAEGGVVRVAFVADGGAGPLYALGADPTGHDLDGAEGEAAFVESVDGGATWLPDVPLSSAPFDLGGGGADLGDRLALDLAGGHVAAAWTDARHGEPTEIWARAGATR